MGAVERGSAVRLCVEWVVSKRKKRNSMTCSTRIRNKLKVVIKDPKTKHLSRKPYLPQSNKTKS